MSEIENEDYKENDLVWAKIKGYPWWPSTISNISIKQTTTLGKTTKEKIYTIELLGEKNIFNVSQEKIEPFTKNYDKHSNTTNLSLLNSIKIAKKYFEKKIKKEKENEEQNKPEKDNNKDTSENKNKLLQKKRLNDRVILDDELNEVEKDTNKKKTDNENNDGKSTPKSNIKINININYNTTKFDTYNINPYPTSEVMNSNYNISTSNNNKSNQKASIPKFNSINYSKISSNEMTENKNSYKKEKFISITNSNKTEKNESKEEEQSIKSLKKEKKAEAKDNNVNIVKKEEKESTEKSNEENEGSECEEDNEELILTKDIINESIQKILNCQIQISNLSSQKTISKELINLLEKFNELFTKSQNDGENCEIYYLSKDLIPILMNLTFGKNSEIVSKSSEIIYFLNQKILNEIFILSNKDQIELLESLNKNEINKETNKETVKDNNNKNETTIEDNDFKEGQNLVDLINKKNTFRSGFSDIHTINSKRGRPKKISTNSEISSEIFSSKITEGQGLFNINNMNEKNYYEEFIKILSNKDKNKIENEFKELSGEFFENTYDKNNFDLEPDMAKVRKNMCIKIYKIIKKIRPEIHSDLIKKMIVYYEYKIRNSISDKIYSCKIKELFETIKERLYDKKKNK